MCLTCPRQGIIVIVDMSIRIAGESFPSIAAVKRRVQGILKADTLSKADDMFVHGLLLRHPSAERKIGSGIERIVVQTVKPYGTRGFYIHRIDGTGTNFSYLECLRPSSAIQKFTVACRTSIVSQTHAIRDAAFAECPVIRCPITGEAVTRQNCHVDHAEPWTFQAIVTEFIDDYEIDVASVALTGGSDNTTEEAFTDQSLALTFAAYHRERAQMRVVSRRANLSVLRKRK
jgi:Protein of unknown function (DUF3223)